MTSIYLCETPVEPSLEFLDNDDAAYPRIEIRAQKLDAACSRDELYRWVSAAVQFVS